MSPVKRLVLDVLKPHQPNALDFAETIAALSDDYRVDLKVIEVRDLIQSIMQNQTVYSDIGNGYRVQSLLDAIELADRNRQWVNVADVVA